MPNFGAGHVPALLRRFGVDVTFASTTVQGIVDREGQRLLEGDGSPAAMIGTEVVVWIQTGSLPGLTASSAITVDGAPYVVSALLEVEDGELTSLLVRKP